MFARLDRIVTELGSAVAELEPAMLDGSRAARLLELCVKAERIAAAGRTLLARRVEESKVWQRSGHRSAGEWLAAKSGISTGHAIGVLETARNLEGAPLTEQQFRAGELSEMQAREVSGAAAAEPRAERDLLAAARTESLIGLRERCRTVRMEASQDALNAYEASRRRRYFRLWSEANGDVRVDGRFPPDDGAALISAIEPIRDLLFREARRAGRREPSDACAADALIQLATRDGTENRSTPRAMVHVLVDHTVLRRGSTRPGERCEIPGVAPIPAATARALTHDSIIKALATNGTHVTRVSHVGRTVPARLRTALEVRDPECVVPGCNVRRGLEIDHYRVPYADGGATSLENLARECRWHHYLRTHCGYRLSGGPGEWIWETPNQIEGIAGGTGPPEPG